MNDQNLTLLDTAAVMKVSPHTLRWWRQQGLGPKSFKLGRHVMYRRVDVEAFLDDAYETTQRGA